MRGHTQDGVGGGKGCAQALKLSAGSRSSRRRLLALLTGFRLGMFNLALQGEGLLVGALSGLRQTARGVFALGSYQTLAFGQTRLAALVHEPAARERAQRHGQQQGIEALKHGRAPAAGRNSAATA